MSAQPPAAGCLIVQSRPRIRERTSTRWRCSSDRMDWSDDRRQAYSGHGQSAGMALVIIGSPQNPRTCSMKSSSSGSGRKYSFDRRSTDG